MLGFDCKSSYSVMKRVPKCYEPSWWIFYTIWTLRSVTSRFICCDFSLKHVLEAFGGDVGDSQTLFRYANEKSMQIKCAITYLLPCSVYCLRPCDRYLRRPKSGAQLKKTVVWWASADMDSSTPPSDVGKTGASVAIPEAKKKKQCHPARMWTVAGITAGALTVALVVALSVLYLRPTHMEGISSGEFVLCFYQCDNGRWHSLLKLVVGSFF